jgi:hypothetical protein
VYNALRDGTAASFRPGTASPAGIAYSSYMEDLSPLLTASPTVDMEETSTATEGSSPEKLLPVIRVPLAAGDRHPCAITDGGAVRCWGSNGSGQLGDGTSTGRLIATDVAGLSGGAVSIAADSEHVCALRESGAVNCWGRGWEGQPGDGLRSSGNLPVNTAGLQEGGRAGRRRRSQHLRAPEVRSRDVLGNG